MDPADVRGALRGAIVVGFAACPVGSSWIRDVVTRVDVTRDFLGDGNSVRDVRTQTQPLCRY